MFRATVKDLLDDCLNQRPDLFLIDFDIMGDNQIKIIIDGDDGVLVEDCMLVSRAIEHNLDREVEDFSLEVASAGATSSLTHARQYLKNIGRTLQVETVTNQKFEGLLSHTDENEIVIAWKAREPKPVGKGKVTVQKTRILKLDEIKEAKVKIKF